MNVFSLGRCVGIMGDCPIQKYQTIAARKRVFWSDGVRVTAQVKNGFLLSILWTSTQVSQNCVDQDTYERLLAFTFLFFWQLFEFLTDECVSDHNERIRSIQINAPYSPTDDEVVRSKRLGNKELVDLYRSNPLSVI